VKLVVATEPDHEDDGGLICLAARTGAPLDMGEGAIFWTSPTRHELVA
jgi:hypothetical protein